MFDSVAIKFGEPVWYDHPYLHPLLQTEVERDFYGFAATRNRLQELLTDGTTDPVIIYGERRSGKTSMLKLLDEQLTSDPARRAISILIPWEGIQSRYELAKTILQQAHHRISKCAPNTCASATDYEIAAATDSGFVTALREMSRCVPGKMFALCIDEFDSIIKRSPSDGKKRILSLADSLVTSRDLPVKLLMTITHTPTISEVQTSPLFARSHRLRLHPFTSEELEEMVHGIMGSEAQKLVPRDQQNLYQLSGGWPYFAKLLLLYMSEIDPGPQWLDHALDQAVNHWGTEQTLNNIYECHLNDDEKAFLLLLAQHEGSIDAQTFAALGEPLRDAANALTVRDFVIRHPDGGYGFRIGFLNEWFNNWGRYEQEVERCLSPTLERLHERKPPPTSSHARNGN
jgi:hypothetical protein